MPARRPELAKTQTFCDSFGIRVPILQAPMAGASPASLAIAVANAGGLGGCGALQMQPDAIKAWSAESRSGGNGAFQINLWVPDPPPTRDKAAEAAMRRFLAHWGPEVPEAAGDFAPPDFAAQCEALLNVGPPIVSTIMGLWPAAFTARLKTQGIRWFATASTVAEARAAEAAGADAVIAQGMEAGGHRGTFEAAQAETAQVGLFALLPAVVDAVSVPVIATGGIADARGVAAALLLGASAVQVGTGFLRCPETKLHPVWADALARTQPEDTMLTRAMSGRPSRAVANAFLRAAAAPDAPKPAPYPVQRGLTQAVRDAANQDRDIERMQALAGQSARLALARPAGEVVETLWHGALALLG